jgi:site-specific recombinase XerD
VSDSKLTAKPNFTKTESKIIEMVIDGMPSEHSRRAYTRALENFFVWYASINRPELNKALVQNYIKILRDAQKLSSANINLQLSAIRKLATEAEDNNLLDSKIANGIRAIKGVAKRGRRTGNWLTREEAQDWLNAPNTNSNKGLRDRALFAIMIGCGLRRSETANLKFENIQQREGRWVIVDIIGKRDKMRSVPMPSWAKFAVDKWRETANLENSYIFRRVNKADKVHGKKITPQAILNIVYDYSKKLLKQGIAPHDLRRTFAKLAYKGGSSLDQIQLSLGHDSIQTTEKYLGVEQDLHDAPCDYLGLKV